MDEPRIAHDNPFEDDSSSRLGLGHGVHGTGEVEQRRLLEQMRAEAQRMKLYPQVENRAAAILAADASREITPDLAFVQAFRETLRPAPSNAGAYADIDTRAREIARVEGIGPSEAWVIAYNEQKYVGDSACDPDPKDDRGNRVTAATLKKDGLKVVGGSKSRSKEPKKAKWICPNCHLEFCHHRPKRGRPRTSQRTERVRARITKEAKAAIKSSGLSESEHLEILGTALGTGRMYDDVAREYRQRRDAVA